MNGGATIGAKLQALVDAECISSHAAAALPETQKTAIENLAPSQIDTLIDVRRLVGAVTNSNFI